MAELDKTISVIESWLKQPVLTPPPINVLYDALELLKEYQVNTPSAGEIAEEMVNYICEHEKVVRCKDCMYFRKHNLFCKKGHANNAKPDWHCGDGVKFDE